MKKQYWFVLALVFAADHMWLVSQIDDAKRAAISEAGDLDRDEVKDACLK